MLKIQNLTKTFRSDFWKKKVTILDNVSFQVEKGQLFGFLGMNGAGKTTTIKIIMGLLFPSHGHVEIMGKSLNDPDVKAKIGFLPENPYFYDYLTAYEFLDFHAQLFGINYIERKKRISKYLSMLGLSGKDDVRLRKFSKGMVQRVGIAAALINDPELIIFDEPLSGLDPIGRKLVTDLILSLRQQNKTVFFSTHILSDVESVCTDIAILHKGKLVTSGSIHDLLKSNNKTLEEMFISTVGAISYD